MNEEKRTENTTSLVPKTYKWEMLGLLWIAYFLNQGDRQIFSAVLPLIRDDMGFSDVQLGLVATIFTVCYGIFVPIAGFSGDIFKRRSVVFGSLLIFSCGTLLTGFSSGLVMLIVFRSITTGVGEAYYYPSANSLIAQYHERTRATAMAIHQTSVYVGIICGGVLAAWIGSTYGWRSSFYFFGSLGVLWAFVLLWRLRNDWKDSGRVAGNNVPVETAPIAEALRHSLGKPTLYLFSLAFAGMVFVNVGFLTWMPTFLFEKFDLDLARANFDAMFYHHLFAALGVLLGAAISDKYAARRKTIRPETAGIGLLLAIPFIFLTGWSDNLLIVYVALSGFGLFRGIYDSNHFASLFDIIAPKYRSTATGLMLAFAFTIGSLCPLVLGWVKQEIGLDRGVMALSVVYLFSALMLFIAVKTTFPHDCYRHPTNGETEP